MEIIKTPMPSYLIVVPSSCQMYSGTGTAIFDWIRFARQRFRFQIIIDNANDANFMLTKQFCAEHEVALTISRALPLPGCVDSGISEVSALLESVEFDFIECVSWANAATNLNVLASRRQGTKLIFVPHSQPLWTLPEPERYFMVQPAFEKILEASDHIFIDSPAELKLEAFNSVRDKGSVHFLPLGVGSDFCYSPESLVQTAQILCVCDCREHRKRIDLLLKAFAHIYAHNPEAHLVLVGKGSDMLDIPQNIRPAVTTLGYVQISTLIDLYQRSAVFMLLSDYEAFGLPIAEALCCECPVLLNDLDVLREVFTDMQGVRFVKNSEIEHVSMVACHIIEENVDLAAIARAASKTFSFSATYGRKCEILLADRGVK